MISTGYNNERRLSTDRRSNSLGGVKWLLQPGQRFHVRRQCDKHRLHVMDHFPPELFYFVLATLLLSVTDAVLTLYLIENGAVELNPVMAFYLKKGPNVFMGVKYFLTATVIVFTVLINYTFIRKPHINFGHMLKLFAACFAFVVIWELFLIARFVV